MGFAIQIANGAYVPFQEFGDLRRTCPKKATLEIPDLDRQDDGQPCPFAFEKNFAFVGIIKLLIWGAWNITNAWSIWRISPLIVHCLGWQYFDPCFVKWALMTNMVFKSQIWSRHRHVPKDFAKFSAAQAKYPSENPFHNFSHGLDVPWRNDKKGSPMKVGYVDLLPPRMNVWYMYLDLPQKSSKCIVGEYTIHLVKF